MIPLLFIGAAAVTSALGVGKTVKAGVDQKDAKDTNERAERIVKRATAKINTCRENCKVALNDLGEQKVCILDTSIKPFIEEFEKLKNVELIESEGMNELQKLVLDQKSFTQLKEVQTIATSMLGGMASGTMAGALTAFGAYSAAMAFGTASTTTAIASLSGAAATNATLAFFGGGSLAAGGLGMAGGTAVLGGLVAGPALAVLGFVVGAKASANKDKAYENLAQAKAFREEMDTAATLCIGIRKRSAMFERFLLSLNAVLEPLAYQMKQIIASKEMDDRGKVNARDLSFEERKVVAQAMSIAGAVKAILDTPILDQEGNLTAESEQIAVKTQQKIGLLMEPVPELINVEKKQPAVKQTSAEAERYVSEDVALEPRIYLQYDGKEVAIAAVITTAKAEFWSARGSVPVESCQVYLKHQENAAYYVINGDFLGKIEL